MKRQAQLTVTVVFLAGLFLFSLATWFSKAPESLFYEQRALSAYPQATKETLWYGDYFTELEAALVDHSFQRQRLLKIHTFCQLMAKRVMVNDIVVNGDILLDYYTYAYWSLDYLPYQAREMAAYYRVVADRVEAYGGTFYYLGFPYQTSYFADYYPDYMETRTWHISAIRAAFGEAMADQGLNFLNMYEEFENLGMPRAYYFATDHHCSIEGAFVAYKILMERIQAETGLTLPVLKEADIDWITLENPFLGSSGRKLYGLWETEDRLEYFTLKEEIPFQRWDNGVEVEAKVFEVPSDEESLTTYTFYMGGDQGETIIKTGRPDLPKMLIYGDSFTNVLETMVWTGFDEMRSLDFRYYTEKTLLAYIEDYRPDIVICVRDETAYLDQKGNGVMLDE